jgi:hypothetical protein
VTGGDVALVITAVGTLVTSLGSVLVSLRNGRKLEEVKQQTQSIATANGVGPDKTVPPK